MAVSNVSTVEPPVAIQTDLEDYLPIQTDLKQNLIYNIVYENVLYCFFVFLGPLVVLIVFNAGLIRELYHAQRRLRERHLPASVIGPEQGEHNLTLVLDDPSVNLTSCTGGRHNMPPPPASIDL